MADPEVRWPDGTEMRPQVDLRFKLDLYAGVRPIYLYASHHTPLQGLEAGDIDLVILRENVEALFASMDGGIELWGESATDTMVITRSGTRPLADYAFRLARERHEARQSSSGPAGSGEPAGAHRRWQRESEDRCGPPGKCGWRFPRARQSL